MKCYVICCTVTSPGNTNILCLSGLPSKRVNACLRLDGGNAKRLHPTSTILSPYDSTCAGRPGATCSRSAGVCPPEVKQVEVTCHLMHADFPCACFYTLE